MGRAFEARKSTKMARWDKMAKEFTRAGREIFIAVKQGGANPDANLALRRAIQNAKSVQMPKDRIESAIKRATSKDAEDLKEMVYEGFSHERVAVIIEATTDNPTRTVANIRAIFRKMGGELGTQGMHDYIFDRKGVFQVPLASIKDLESFEFSLIDFGLQSLVVEEKDGEQYVYIYTDFADFSRMQEGLEQLGIAVETAKFEQIPKEGTFKKVEADQIDNVFELIDRLEQDEDVSQVFCNLELD